MATNDDFWSTTPRYRLDAITERIYTSLATSMDPLLVERDIDAELRHIDDYRQQILAQRNLLAPAARLPPDILMTLFSHIAPVMSFRDSYRAVTTYQDIENSSESHEVENREQDIEDILSIISASQVCRRWRDVALHDPSLWVNLWTENLAWAQQMLTRAQGMALELYAAEEPYRLNFICACLAIMRCRRLCVFIPTSLSVADILSRPAPWLEVLHIELERIYTYHPPNINVSSQIFSQESPRLRHLRISGSHGYRELLLSPVLHNLTSLELFSEQPLSPIPSIPALLDALKRMPHLDNLALDNVLPTKPLRLLPSAYLSSSDIVQLPSMLCLTLAGYSSSCANFTQHIRLPPDCRIRYCMIYRNEDDGCSPQDTVPYLFGAAPRLMSSPIQSLWMCIEAYNLCYHFTCWDVVLSPNLLFADVEEDNVPPKQVGSRLDFRFEDDTLGEEDINFEMIKPTCEHLCLDELKDLIIDYTPYTRMHNFGLWSTIFERMRRVENLVLRYSAYHEILEIISMPSRFASQHKTTYPSDEDGDLNKEEGDKGNTSTILLPSLSSVCLQRWYFNDEEPLPQTLLDCFQAISSRPAEDIQRRTALRELRIVNCTITAAQVGALENLAIAEAIIWDGRTQSTKESGW